MPAGQSEFSWEIHPSRMKHRIADWPSPVKSASRKLAFAGFPQSENPGFSECGIPREEASGEELRLRWPVLVLTICKTP
jgi:hypothetical protein